MAVEIVVQGNTTLTGKQTTTTPTEETQFLQKRSVSRRTLSLEGQLEVSHRASSSTIRGVRLKGCPHWAHMPAPPHTHVRDERKSYVSAHLQRTMAVEGNTIHDIHFNRRN